MIFFSKCHCHLYGHKWPALNSCSLVMFCSKTNHYKVMSFPISMGTSGQLSLTILKRSLAPNDFGIGMATSDQTSLFASDITTASIYIEVMFLPVWKKKYPGNSNYCRPNPHCSSRNIISDEQPYIDLSVWNRVTVPEPDLSVWKMSQVRSVLILASCLETFLYLY